MTKYVDSNIPIQCWDCEGNPDWDKEIGCAYGLQAMAWHLQTVHAEKYPSVREAVAQAEYWMEGAYGDQDAEDEAYHNNQILVRSLRRQGGED